MNSRQGNVYIEDRQENQSFEDPEPPQQKQDNTNSDHNINDEEIDQLLDDDLQSREEMVLKFKVNELQKICNSLTTTNRKLIAKVTSLEEEREGNHKEEEIFVDEYSELNGQFTEVQSLIQEYKHSLDLFQKNALIDMKGKQQKINKLKKEYKDLYDRYQELELEKDDIEKLNKQLETRNEGLILEIQNLEKEKCRIEQKLNAKPLYTYGGIRYDNHGQLNNNEYELPSEIQNQYELIIDKLVKQLEYEKNIKKKMNDEIKRMSHELMESEREIMNKNKKLYQIEMKLLRSSKTTADSSINYNAKFRTEDVRLTNNNGRHETTQKYTNSKDRIERSEQKLNFKSFILLQLINGELDQDISNTERKIIGIKVIQFYERKIQREDFSNVMTENLLICNFSHKKPELMSIRKVGTSAYEQGEKTEESLVWNLAFILDNLFGQNQGVEDFDEILEVTGQVLEKQMDNNKDTLQCMKQILSV